MPIKPGLRDGVLPIAHDTSNDYSHIRTFAPLFGSSQTLLTGLPDTYQVPPQQICEQENTSFCAPTTVAEAIAQMAGIPMTPDWQTALTGKLAGAPIYNGTDPKTALKAGTIGCLPQSLAPFTLAHDGMVTVADWHNWPAILDGQAAMYKRASYYSVMAGNPDDFDYFDAIRLALWQARADKAPVMVFGFWYNEWNSADQSGIVGLPGKPISRHAYLFTGWKMIAGKRYLIAQLSSGKDFGDRGFLYISQEATEKAFLNMKTYGLGLYLYRTQNPSFWQNAVSTLRSVLNIYPNEEPPMTPPSKNSLALYEAARIAIGTDPTPKDEVDDRVSCAASVNAIFKKAIGVEVGGKASTRDMKTVLDSNPQRFRKRAKFTDAQPGDIIMSASKTPGARLQVGHVGVVMKYGICSITSEFGTWEQNYDSVSRWNGYFGIFGGMQTEVYEVL